MIIEDKLYILAKEHTSPEASMLIDLVEKDADVDSIEDAVNDFLTLLCNTNEITEEQYEELMVLTVDDEIETVYTEEDDVPEED